MNSSWLDAVFVRVSRRSFAVEAPGEELLGRLERVCREFRPFPEARAGLAGEWEFLEAPEVARYVLSVTSFS